MLNRPPFLSSVVLRGVLCFVLCVAGFAAPARAQSAPEGNAHPQSKMVASEAEELPNPFGDAKITMPSGDGFALRDQKVAFARAVNLEPLRAIGVFHNGRVKILDTLARESVRTITGRRTYVDFLHASGGAADSYSAAGITSFAHDPLFTFFDLVIDPGYYLDKPLLGIGYLPLRTAFVEAAFAGAQNKEQQERWLKLTRITPLMVDRYAAKIASEHMSEEPYRKALGELDRAIEVWREGKANLMLVAPGDPSLPWKHVSTLAADSPVRTAMLELGTAWRSMDAARTNAAIATLARELAPINDATSATANGAAAAGGHRNLELLYNKANAFEWGFWAYALALVTLILAFGTGRVTLAWLGSIFLVLAVGLHGFGFVSRCLIAERFAIQNQFESMTGLSLFAALVGLVIMLARRQWLFGAASAGVGFLVLITATQTAIPGQNIEREAAILNTSVLLKYHVTTVLVSYGLIALGFIISLFYLGAHYFARRASAGTFVRMSVAGGGEVGATIEAGAPAASGVVSSASRAKLLADLDKAQMVVLQLAFWTLGVGILLGAWWADHSWGRWWAFDPKETWALLTWIVYLIVIHLRFANLRDRGLTTAWLSLLGFVVMLFTYFGVNLLLPGLHAYA
ncbi:MAG: cytochrome c biogenesis protein CcsA [Planctomycetota bacterium]|nr:cytochrome c biogenesis protein CcsA [Planctomycetota bacterium]